MQMMKKKIKKKTNNSIKREEIEYKEIYSEE